MFVSLAIVLGLIVLLWWGVKRFFPQVATQRASRAIQVLSKTPIAPRQQIMVLQVGYRLIVVGDSGQQMSTLCEITDPDEAASLLAQIRAEKNQTTGKSFSTMLARASEKFSSESRKAQQTSVNASEDPEPDLEAARQKVNDLAAKVREMSQHFHRA